MSETPDETPVEEEEFDLTPDEDEWPEGESPYDDDGDEAEQDVPDDDATARRAGATAPRMGREAIRWALGKTSWSPSGMCQQFTRMSFGVGSGFGSAAAAWRGARKKHPTRNPASVPPGVPVYYEGGSRGYGHAAVSLGNGLVRSTDWPSRYRVGTARIMDLERSWGQRFVGWTEDINGVTVYQKPAARKPKTPNITEALRARDPAKRRAALRKVAQRADGKRARSAAQKWLDALNDRDAAERKIKAARESLAKHEVK